MKYKVFGWQPLKKIYPKQVRSSFAFEIFSRVNCRFSTQDINLQAKGYKKIRHSSDSIEQISPNLKAKKSAINFNFKKLQGFNCLRVMQALSKRKQNWLSAFRPYCHNTQEDESNLGKIKKAVGDSGTFVSSASSF
ncbi:MAG: hypothetical protein QNJ54_30515 [Prochloraceae cyanobacterium]|nr:hypothetical protein [Prochloraceae cyanobacterium]